MKRYLIFLAFLLVVLCIHNIGSSATITGKTITGKATSQTFGMNITITVSLPSLTIISPENTTYISNISLLLNYTTTGLNLWYNIDQVSNITITSPTYFNTSQGLHTLYLYANNSVGTTIRNVTFTVDSSLLTILYEEYKGATRGSSTDFDKIPYDGNDDENLQNLSNIILENTDHGKISFNQAINVTDDSNFSDNLVDLDTYTHISSNRIELDATALPNFNVASTLSLYNLTFTNPRILKDGAVCPSSICTQQSYTGGTLIFNVTEFSVYSAEETPGVTTAPSGGRRRISGAVIEESNITINKDLIKVTIKQGETQREIIKLENTGNKTLNLTITPETMGRFMVISETAFVLEPGEKKEIIIDIFAKEDEPPEAHTGRILIKDEGEIEKIINVIIEIKEKKALFDLQTQVLTKEVEAGDDVEANIKMTNLGDLKNIDIHLYYSIKDFQGNTLAFREESLAINDELEIKRELKIPQSAPYGAYVFYSKISYENITASSADNFMVVEKEINYLNLILLIIGIILILILIIYELNKLRPHKRGIKRKKPLYKQKTISKKSKRKPVKRIYQKKDLNKLISSMKE
jgi:hypothetical protein